MAGESDTGATAWPPRMAVCVGAVVLRKGGVLLVRQAAGHALGGQWSIPWGLVDEGEAPEAAALRETYEESGVQAELKGLLGIQNLSQAGWLGLVLLCHHVAGQPAPDGIETDRAAYFSWEALDALEEPIEHWCEWLVRRVLRGDYTLIPALPDNPYRPRLAFL
ncbi:MAG: NUDIX domain-containing protein [Anaerolineae bacterium]|nr:NUDIX domain-containing protein [Anaerolineae bacterium]